jgi:uncharacterized protein (DUF1778 family)
MSNTASVKVKNMNVRTSEEEYRRIKEFARFQGKTLSAFVLDAVWERMNDWEDRAAVEEYMADTSSREKPLSHDDFMAELGLR